MTVIFIVLMFVLAAISLVGACVTVVLAIDFGDLDGLALGVFGGGGLLLCALGTVIQAIGWMS